MRINDNKPISSVTTARKAKKSGSVSSVDFAHLLSQAEGTEEAAADGTNAVGDAAPVAAVSDSLLSLQEVPEEEYRDRKAAAQGRITLDRLEDLRNQLLGGTISISTLHNLEQVIASQRKFAAFNPRLREILDEIELRAAVELAKLERAGIT